MVNISESGLVVTVISPVYNGAKMLPQLVRETLHYATQINPLVELILIDDHSPDNSWAVIEALCKQYPGKSARHSLSPKCRPTYRYFNRTYAGAWPLGCPY